MSAAVVYMQMSAREAEVITEQIVGRLDQVAESIDAVRSLMRDALSRQAHAALGYDSPGAYMRDRFEGALVNLSAALRREIVAELSESGMSTRAIAPIVGVDQKTVVRDVAREAHASPAEMEPSVNLETGEITELGESLPTVTEHTFTEKVKTTVGLDGKTYTKPEPKPVPTGDAANQINAETMSKEIGHAIDILSLFENASHRTRVLTSWWPLGNGAVPPASRALFNPAQLRQIAASLGQLATEMESTNV